LIPNTIAIPLPDASKFVCLGSSEAIAVVTRSSLCAPDGRWATRNAPQPPQLPRSRHHVCF
jgi:hypothetical protein